MFKMRSSNRWAGRHCACSAKSSRTGYRARVLRVRTDNLRRSIHQRVNVSGNVVSGEVNTNVRYGIAHEYGFAGSVNVKASLRQVRQAFGRPLKPPRYVHVRAHTRDVKLPERSFLRSALRDLTPKFADDLQKSIGKVLK